MSNHEPYTVVSSIAGTLGWMIVGAIYLGIPTTLLWVIVGFISHNLLQYTQ